MSFDNEMVHVSGPFDVDETQELDDEFDTQQLGQFDTDREEQTALTNTNV